MCCIGRVSRVPPCRSGLTQRLFMKKICLNAQFDIVLPKIRKNDQCSNGHVKSVNILATLLCACKVLLHHCFLCQIPEYPMNVLTTGLMTFPPPIFLQVAFLKSTTIQPRKLMTNLTMVTLPPFRHKTCLILILFCVHLTHLSHFMVYQC